LTTLSLIVLLFLGRPNWQALPQPRAVPPSRVNDQVPIITKHPVPAGRTIIGGIDSQEVGKLHGESDSLLEAFGWVASAEPGDPIKELRILINGRTMATIHTFLPRPDVAAYFDRPDFNMSGWRTAVSLEGIKAGEYELGLRAATASGKEGSLPSLKLVVSE